mmetsp:Transcript_112023/g.280665  ORF Transcript_112023/g.280665 Transcript_112023/m.280665 type:complete len:236 (+) Transcript_112023:525-1232(+)
MLPRGACCQLRCRAEPQGGWHLGSGVGPRRRRALPHLVLARWLGARGPPPQGARDLLLGQALLLLHPQGAGLLAVALPEFAPGLHFESLWGPRRSPLQRELPGVREKDVVPGAHPEAPGDLERRLLADPDVGRLHAAVAAERRPRRHSGFASSDHAGPACSSQASGGQAGHSRSPRKASWCRTAGQAFGSRFTNEASASNCEACRSCPARQAGCPSGRVGSRRPPGEAGRSRTSG